MIKTNLPTVLLKGLILLPHNEMKIEFRQEEEKQILKNASVYHDNHVLIVSLEEEVTNDVKKMPKIGVIAKIKSKVKLNNERIRIELVGISRVVIHSYLNFNNPDDILEGIISPVFSSPIEGEEAIALKRKLLKDLDQYFKSIPFISNSILNQIVHLNNIGEISDIVANHLLLPLFRKQEYLKETNPTTRIMMLLEDIRTELEAIKIEKEIDKELQIELDKTQKEFILREKINIIKKELGEINSKEEEVDILTSKLKKLTAPKHIKDKLKQEIKKYTNMNLNSPEVSMIRNYIDWLFSLPWHKTTKDESDLKKIRISLDKHHYALDEVKERIIEYIAVKHNTNNMTAPIICFVGPPGTGKTTLAKSIADALGRNFVKISVGGVNDEAELVGHRRTYIGSSPGRIIQAMKKSKTVNPVFLIDEIDKMTKDFKGDPASSLLDVLDKEQNKYFSDNYIEEEYDLSQVMFILTANYFYQIPEALRDRLEIIELSSYTEYEKQDIAHKHIIPLELEQHNLDKKQVSFNKDSIIEIIRYYTKEAGVRELNRLIAKICRKIVIAVLDKPKGTYKVTKTKVETYLGYRKYNFGPKIKNGIGVINGLAYTSFGGDTITIEVNLYNGKGNLLLTGSLGEVMRESAQIALSYIKSNSKEFKIKEFPFDEIDIHIHIPEGAIPKDGPSAGITLTTALISAFSNKTIKPDISMTGEITLRGNVLPIGGLKEKIIGAKRNNIKEIIIPIENKNDIEDLPKEIKEGITFYFVNSYQEIYKLVFEK